MARFARLTSLTLLTAALVGGPFVPPAGASATGGYERSAIRHANTARTARRLPALRASSCLDTFAERQARAMAAHQRMFHQDLGPILRRCGLSQVGENVAFGYPSGKAVTAAWMDSPAHRANLLNPRHRLIGVGAYRDARGYFYVAEVLGRAR